MKNLTSVPHQLQLFGDSFEYAVSVNNDIFFVSPYLDICKNKAREIYVEKFTEYEQNMKDMVFDWSYSDSMPVEPIVKIHDLDSFEVTYIIS